MRYISMGPEVHCSGKELVGHRSETEPEGHQSVTEPEERHSVTEPMGCCIAEVPEGRYNGMEPVELCSLLEQSES